MVEFRRQNESLVFGSGTDDNIVTRRMETLLAQLSEARVTTMQAEVLSQKAETMAHDPVALGQFLEIWRGRGIGNAPTNEAATLQAELKRMERDKADVLLELKPNHPAIVALDVEIERVRRQITELNQQFVQNQLTTAKEREEELERQYATLRAEALLLDDLQAQYVILQSEYEQTKQLRDVLYERIKERSIREEVGGLNVTVLERAQVAGAPSEPRKARVMAIALFLGGCAGMGLGLIRELSDKRIRSSREIAALLRLPILGVIPKMRSFLRSGTLRSQIVRVCPTSPEAEAFRRLRTPFLFGLLSDSDKTILVTSAAAGEGKSLLVSNLATAMAQTGQKVLIVDADCHAPSQHKIFNKDRHKKGLSMVLTGPMTWEDAIEPTRTSNLDLLTCGPAVSSPTEMFAGERWQWLVTILAGQYDRVLIDSPPLLAVTDAQILAAQCDGVVLVLRADASTRKDSVQACGELTAVGARILGAVINAAPCRGNRYGYHYGYGYNQSCRPGRPVEALLEEKSETQNKNSGTPFERVFDRRATVSGRETEWSRK